MEKVKINMIGGGFQHDACSSAGAVPKYMEWVKCGSNISIHIDEAIKLPSDKSKINYAWLAESSAIIPEIIKWIPNNIPFLEENFEMIFTHDKRLLPFSNKIKLVICASTVPWVKDRKINTKSKLISMIASNKRYCPGHNYRQLIVERYRGKVDCFGKGHRFIEKKEMGLNDYYFSIAMENDSYPNYFTEKLSDCFVTGTIPIYWGHSFIGEFFNEKGIIPLTDDFKVESLSPDLYFSKMEYIKENFELAINLPVAEDYIFEKFIK